MRASILLLAIAAAQAPPQAGPAGLRTGIIAGQIVDATSGSGVPEVIVTMTMPDFPPNAASTPKGRVLTDADGRFFFTDLPAGNYSFTATKDGYLRGNYGMRRPLGASTPLVLAENERRSDATIRLWKHAAISGTVVDDAGEPLVRVSVRALSRTIVAGRTQFGALGTPTTFTDDRGVYRIAGLIPADYVVSVPTSQTTLPLSVELALGTQDAALARETLGVINGYAPLGQPGNQQFGDFVLATPTYVPFPPFAGDRLAAYRTTFFPSAAAITDATAITVKAGEERGGVDLQLKSLPAVRVSGRLVSPTGKIGATGIRLLTASATDMVSVSGFEAATGMTDASGAFTFLAVPSGQYRLKVLTPRDSSAVPSTPDRPVLWADVPLTVGTTDLVNLDVRLQPTLRVEGRIEFKGKAKAPSLDELTIYAFVLESAAGAGRVATPFDRSGTFAAGAVAGSYFVRPEEPVGWMLRSVMLDGRDVSDVPLDLKTDVTGLVMTFADEASELSGIVRNAQGLADGTATVLVFPADPERWTAYGVGPRRLLSRATNPAGRYSVSNLPPGDYFVIAVDDAQLGSWADPKKLQAFAAQATRVTLGDVEKRTIDLTTKVSR